MPNSLDCRAYPCPALEPDNRTCIIKKTIFEISQVMPVARTQPLDIVLQEVGVVVEEAVLVAKAGLLPQVEHCPDNFPNKAQEYTRAREKNKL